MGKSIPAIVTPEVLSWARGLDKITVAEIAKKIKVDTAKVLAWEAGSEYPTLAQAKKPGQTISCSICLFLFT